MSNKPLPWFFLLPSSFFRYLCREAIDRGLQALSKVVPGGDTLMNLGLQMVRMSQTSMLEFFFTSSPYLPIDV